MSTNVEPEVWTKEALASLLGTCDGYIHAIVALKLRIGQMNYRPIDKRHVRRIAQREATVRPLREMMERLEGDLRQCQAAYQEHLVRRNAIMEGDRG
jgi:hypothetical protein